MNERAHPNPESGLRAIRTEGTFGSAWRSYCADSNSGYADMPILDRALMSMGARLRFRHVRHVTFEQLSSAGYDVQTFDADPAPIDLEKIARTTLAERWKIPQTVIAPKIATLRDAVLFESGLALLPDGRCRF